MTEDYSQIERLAKQDVEVLKIKGQQYGRSWLKRGGVGAFMMLARKWDRVENDASKMEYDILRALTQYGDSLLDDIQDLRRYLLLVESEYLNSLPSSAPPVLIHPSQPMAPQSASLPDMNNPYFDDDIPF